MRRLWRRRGAALAVLVCWVGGAHAAEVNLYTDRQEVFLRPLIERFERESGVRVNVLFAKSGLLERLRAEGDSSPADVVMAVDVGRLQDFVGAGLLAPYADAALRGAVSPSLRTDYWLAVTRRARVLFVRKGEEGIGDYQDLAAPENKGKVCMRSGKHTYNISLIADRIARNGAPQTAEWLRGVKANLARPPRGNDRAQISGVVDGICAAAVANLYYYFRLGKDPEMRARLRETVTVVIPKNAHINVTGIALAAHAPHREEALRFMRFLLGDTAQAMVAAENGEFPARDGVAYPPDLRPFQEALNDGELVLASGDERRRAAELVDDAAFDW